MKKNFFLIVLILFLIFSLSLLFLNSTPVKDVLLGVTGFSPIKKEKDVALAAKNLIVDKEKVLVDLEKENVCYWFRSTRNKTNYLLEINEYEHPSGMEGCFGHLKSTRHIILDKPINLKGVTCLCSNNNYQLEWEKGLKIIKSTK